MNALLVLATSLPYALLWIGAAVGLGWPLRRLLAHHAQDGLAIQVGLGVAAMLVLDSALGRLGSLQWGGSIGGWTFILIGLTLLTLQVLAGRRSPLTASASRPWLICCSLPAMGVLLLAACSAPTSGGGGGLWASEFGGYDALSYHLQLPKEWLALGRITPLPHNVYSHLPGFMEAAYYHLAVLIGDGIAAVYACQLLHVAMTLITACLVARLAGHAAHERSRPLISAAAACLFLGTPWVIVVGSLAYNEVGAALMLACGLLMLRQENMPPTARGVALGLLIGAACGAKLTAAGFIALPLLVLLLCNLPRRQWLVATIPLVLLAALTLTPWLIANAIRTGNPVFPFLTSWLGTGHWTSEQARIFTAAHVPAMSTGSRIIEAWNQFWRYGIGPAPDADPWQPQWSILPWLALIGLVVGLLSRRDRRWTVQLAVVLAIQLAFWISMTHIKSRFMLPAVMPLSLLAVIGLANVGHRLINDRPGKLVLALALLIWCSLPVVLYFRETNGQPGSRIGVAELLAGDGLTTDQARELAEGGPRWIYVNRLLSKESKVLLVGDAAPLYYRGNVIYQTTWDRGPLSIILREHPDDPAVWTRSLCDQGFTHVLIDPVMLDLWQRAGWNDPLLTIDRVNQLTNHAQRLATLSGEATLWQLDCQSN